MLILLALASVAAAAPQSAECEQSISKQVAAADPETRVVVTFTGSQNALLPLDEAADPGMESTLFPVTKDRFVLTLQVRRPQPGAVAAAAFAKGVCAIGLSRGGRFNGVMSFKRETMTSGGRALTRERMTDAMMAEPPKD